jgi:hypothetical protein
MNMKGGGKRERETVESSSMRLPAVLDLEVNSAVSVAAQMYCLISHNGPY